MVKIICPICQQQKTKYFHRTNNYSYYQCYNCQSLFLHPLPKIKGYYEKDFTYLPGLANEKNIRQRAITVLKKLRQLNPSGCTLLDIGSGFGFFLDEASKAGFKSLGLEPAKKLMNYHINQINQVINSDFKAYYRQSKKDLFDFIILNHVIEHVPMPKDFLTKALSLLKENGILYLETPNLESWLFRAEKKAYTFLTPPEHLYLFSAKSFRFLLPTELWSSAYSTYTYTEQAVGIFKYWLKPKQKRKESVNKENCQSGPLQQVKNSSLKFLIIDKVLASLSLPFLNAFNQGSILSLYVRKKRSSKSN